MVEQRASLVGPVFLPAALLLLTSCSVPLVELLIVLDLLFRSLAGSR